jgi:hypothetical protein
MKLMRITTALVPFNAINQSINQASDTYPRFQHAINAATVEDAHNEPRESTMARVL